MAFFEHYRRGAYKELISDGRVMAVVDTATYIAEQDAVNATIRGARWGD